jgi:tetratricopeptide (TPR) repeat protein/ferric-dicitrate binding protein FerR (iron transport regulator)
MMHKREDMLRAALLRWAEDLENEELLGKLVELRDDVSEVTLTEEVRQRQLEALLQASRPPRAKQHLNGQVHLNGKATRKVKRSSLYLSLGAAAAAAMIMMALLLPWWMDAPRAARGEPVSSVQVLPQPPAPEATEQGQVVQADPVRGSSTVPLMELIPRQNGGQRAAPGEAEPVVPPQKPTVAAIGFVTAMTGEPTVQSGREPAEVATVQQKLYRGARVATGDIDQLELRLFDRVTLRLDFNTEIVIPPDESDQVELVAGKVWASVDKMPLSRKFAVETPVATATVLGTKFSLELEGLQPQKMRAVLKVDEGTVKLANSLGSVHVGAQMESSAEWQRHPAGPRRFVIGRGMFSAEVHWVEALPLYDSEPVHSRLHAHVWNTGSTVADAWATGLARETLGAYTSHTDRIGVVLDVMPGSPHAPASRVGDVLGRFWLEGELHYGRLREGAPIEFELSNSGPVSLFELDFLIKLRKDIGRFQGESRYGALIQELRRGNPTAPLSSLHYAASVLLFAKKDLPGAYRHCRAALQLAPNDPHLNLHYAEVLLSSGNLRMAREVARRLYERTNWSVAASRLAGLYLVEGDVLAAIGVLGRAALDHPDDVWISTMLSHSFTRAGDSDAARTVALDLIRERPFDWRGYWCASISYLESGEYDAALEFAIASKQRAPIAFCYNLVGVIHLLKRDYYAAEQALSLALGLEPDEPASNFNLGQTFWAMGKHEAAHESYTRAAKLDPQSRQFQAGVARSSRAVIAHLVEAMDSKFGVGTRRTPRLGTAKSNLQANHRVGETSMLELLETPKGPVALIPGMAYLEGQARNRYYFLGFGPGGQAPGAKR